MIHKKTLSTFAALALVSSVALAAGVSAQSPDEDAERAKPVAFSGALECGFGSSANGYELGVLEMSDPRLDGQVMHYFDSVAVDAPEGYEGDAIPEVATGTWQIVNDDGAWQGSFHTIFLDDAWTPTVYPLYGSGAYEGLVALHQHRYLGGDGECGWEVNGLIIDGALPDFPVPPSS